MIEEVVKLAESWETKRKLVREFSRSDLDKWVGDMNYHSKMLISALGRQQPDVYDALAELCHNAATLLTKGAKIVADGKDVTKEG